MLAVRMAVPSAAAGHPPIVFVHGAANSSLVWRLWQETAAARGWPSWALDLRGHGDSDRHDLARTSMADYVDDVMAVARELPSRPVLIGWSMGGLVAMLAAARDAAVACVGLGPSPPSRARDSSLPLRTGLIGPEEYGIVGRDPRNQPTMPDLDPQERTIALSSLGPESQYARDDRKAGIVITRLPCPLLVVAGSADQTFPPATYADLPLSAARIDVDGASHWGLVLNRRALAPVIPRVLDWAARVVSLARCAH